MLISTNKLIGNVFFEFRNTVLCEGIIFTYTSLFLETKKSFSLLFSKNLMKSIKFHIRGFNAQGNISYVIDHYVSTDFLFQHFGELKSKHFHIAPFRFRKYVLNN